MDELNRLINQLIKEKGGTKQQYLHLLDVISNHETKRTFDTKSIQDEGDPTNYGSGLYHFETGKNKGGITAARRAVNVYNKKGYPIPSWLKDATAGSELDAGQLTPQQQSVLFLANHIEHPKSDFSKIWKGEQSIPEFWSENHQADPDKKQRKLKEKRFKEDYERYQEQGHTYPEIDKSAPETDRWNAYTDELSKNDLYTAAKQSVKKNQIQFALGGNIQDLSHLKQSNNNSLYRRNFNTYNTGGLHSQNPLGGVPIGRGANGKINTIEQGESAYNFKTGKFIFSNRIKI